MSAAPTIMDRLASSWRRPVVVWSFVAISLLALLSIRPQADPDLFARVAVGRLIEVSGGVVDQDPFAFTPKLPRWVDHEWLAGVVFWRTARLGGDTALLLLNLGSMLATTGLLVLAQRILGRTSLAWSLATILPVMGVWISVVRSRIFTFVFVALLLYALTRWRKGDARWLWALPVCFVPWANAHGGFVAGLGLLGAAAVAAAVAERRGSWPLWACLAGCTAATLVNPYGLEYWSYILGATTMEREIIVEWQGMRPWQMGLAVVLLATFLQAVRKAEPEDRPPPEAWGLLFVSVLAALESQRLLNFLLVCLFVYGARPVGALGDRLMGALGEERRRAVRDVAGVVAMASVVVLMVVGIRNYARFTRTGLTYEQYPVGAVEWLDLEGGGGRVLTHFNHGSYALWRLYPRYRVAIDGRYEETYPEETVDLAWAALQPLYPGHAEALEAVDPDYVVVPTRAWAEDFGPGWRVVYADSSSVVIAGDDPPPGPAEPRPSRSMWTPAF